MSYLKNEGPNLFLEDVNIEGFKSFSEMTNMSFQPGIGVIIGNNGVGKSNILDAIVWALGENDSDRLRLQDQKELFFAGSKDYAPATRVHVELNFKRNKDDASPELQITREKYLDGRESNRIDGAEYSRADYLLKLKDLGFNDSLKTIVRQEQINDILFLRPEQRLDVIRTLMALQDPTEAHEIIERSVSPRFSDYFNLLMPEGRGRLSLIRNNGASGLEIEVTLRGDRSRKAHQLSGGEKSVTSLALKSALFERFKSPLYLLDEVEPSLDYMSHKSMQAFLKTIAQNKQLIMITHLRSTIELADTLHGVRTRRDGSSFMKFYFVMDERLLRLYKCC